jgi:hypothetical protein
MVQLRPESLSEVDRENARRGLEVIETQVQQHLHRAHEQQIEAENRSQQLEEDHDGTAEYDQAIDEVAKRIEVLEADKVSCGVVFAQVRSKRSGIDIGKVLTTDKSLAYVGLPQNVVGKINLRIGEVTTQGESTSHVGVFKDDVVT